MHNTDVLCSFHGIKPLVQCLEFPSYSNEKLTSQEDDFKYSTVLQTFLQLAPRLNTMFIKFCVTPGSYLYTEYQKVWNMFFSDKLKFKWINHSMCKAYSQLVCKYCVLLLFLEVTYKQLRVPRNSAVEYPCKLCCQTSGIFLKYTVNKPVYSSDQEVFLKP